MQALQFVAHVLEEKYLVLQVGFQFSFGSREQSYEDFDPFDRYEALKRSVF